jgi:hypothetical protein
VGSYSFDALFASLAILLNFLELPHTETDITNTFKNSAKRSTNG